VNWSATDISAFKSALGQPVNLDDGSLSGTDIVGIFSAPFEAVNQFDGSVESSGPFIDCATADVAEAEHNQGVTTGGVDYVITGIQNEGTGWTRLYLRERFD